MAANAPAFANTNPSATQDADKLESTISKLSRTNTEFRYGTLHKTRSTQPQDKCTTPKGRTGGAELHSGYSEHRSQEGQRGQRNLRDVLAHQFSPGRRMDPEHSRVFLSVALQVHSQNRESRSGPGDETPDSCGISRSHSRRIAASVPRLRHRVLEGSRGSVVD